MTWNIRKKSQIITLMSTCLVVRCHSNHLLCFQFARAINHLVSGLYFFYISFYIKCIVLYCRWYGTMLIAPPTGKTSIVPLQVPNGNALNLHFFILTRSDTSLWVQLVDSPFDSRFIPPLPPVLSSPLLSLFSHSACLIPSHRIFSHRCVKPDLENYWWKVSRERLLSTSLMCEDTRSTVSPNHTLLDWTQALHGLEY